MFLLGSLLERARRCSHVMTRGLDMRVLDGVNAWSFAGFGWESFAWVRCTGFTDGVLPMGSIPGSVRVMRDLMGSHFGWVVDFFLGGAGEGKRNSRPRLPRRFRRRREFQTVLYVLYYILRSGSFAAAWERPSRTVAPILDDLGRHVRCSVFDNPST